MMTNFTTVLSMLTSYSEQYNISCILVTYYSYIISKKAVYGFLYVYIVYIIHKIKSYQQRKRVL